MDIPNLVDYAKTLPNVVYAMENKYSCSQLTQDIIKEKIAELDLNRVVVAACTPRTHEPLFQKTIREAGLNEWAVHPGLENAELIAIENDSKHVRQTDYELLISQEAKAIIKEEGIRLLSYREIQSIWNKVSDE